jgi:glycosyltransferase involved in cell wall biosynthesis
MSRPLRVALMAFNATGLAGVPRYARMLVSALDTVASDYPGLELTLVGTGDAVELIAPRRLRTWMVPLLGRSLSGPARLAIEQLVLPLQRAHLVHFFDVNGTLLPPRRPFVATFHDASIRRTIASNFEPFRRRYKLRLYPWSLTRASAIVAISQFAKDEVVRHFGVDAARVTVIHSGPGLAATGLAAAANDDGDARAPARARPYLLFVGNLTASKNLPFLVHAFDQADVPVDLVLAGRPLDDLDAIQGIIHGTRSRERVHLVLQPSDTEVNKLYRGALAFVFPSRYEGFGFPPLEAMSAGVPVVASDLPVLREVLGDAALFADPLDTQAITGAILRLASDDEERTRLFVLGKAQAGRFSWERCAEQTLAVYEQAVVERARPRAPVSATR